VTRSRQEVLTVKVLNPIERPSALPAVCAQVFGVRIRSASGVARDLLVGHPSVRAMAADAPQLPQVHQVSGRAAVGRAAVGRARAQMVWIADSYGTDGTTGFRANDIPTAKRIVDGVSGAPPRGRPV
jgi:hypothetical protein